jgi:DNA-binding NarL/FixJ family response regulator
LASGHDVHTLPSPLARLLGPENRLVESNGALTSWTASEFGSGFESQAAKLTTAETASLTLGLIDSYRLSRECLTKSIETLHPKVMVAPFACVQDCIIDKPCKLDLTIYYPHDAETIESAVMQNVATIRAALPDLPIVVLSDRENAQQPETVRSILNSGAQGFIPTQAIGIPMVMAAIHFIKAGGTFAPLDQLLTNRPDRRPTQPEAVPKSLLTSRQMAVLSLLQQGKANKIIAYELNMSESTVKVHVRNLMRRMGASNRTQAAYKAQQLLSNASL